MMRRLPLVLAVLAAGCGGSDDEPAPTPTPAGSPRAASPTPSPSPERPSRPRASVVASGLEIPWEIAWLDDGRALVTERVGRVRMLSAEGELLDEPVAEIDVDEAGEGGLMGMAVRGDRVWLYMTRGGANELVRYRFDGERLTDEEVLVEGIGASSIHSGGRLRFGPDGMLYLGVGDAAEPSVAQDPDALNGKILRVDPDSGDVEIHSLGHRNPQGFDWEPGTERMIADEHGAAGNDEVNIIRRGANYGWPEIEGEQTRSGMRAPIQLYQSPGAPSGGSFYRSPGSAWTGSYLIAMLAGQRLQRLEIDGDEVVEDERLFEGRWGRLRQVTEGPDGALYVLTSNRDGRGAPTEEDDRIIRIEPPG